MNPTGSGTNTDTAAFDALLVAGERLIIERGMEAVTLAALAERSGVALEQVQRHFSDPAAAISAVIAADEAHFLRAVQIRARKVPAPQRLRALIEACVSEYDWTLWIELWSHALREPWAVELRQALDDDLRAALADLIREGQAAGDFAPTDPDRAAIIVSCLLDGFATQATLGDSRVSARFMHRACLWTVERLLGPSSGMEVQTENA